MQKINIGFLIDLQKLIESRMLIQANSGGGKSYLIRKILETIHGIIPFIVFDLEGEFISIREKYDVIIFGKGHDIPLNVEHADKLARYLLELKASAIMDLSEMHKDDRILFVKRFLESMMDAPKDLWHPTAIVIDEAHKFCPEDGKVASAEAVVDLCTRGRKRGYCAILATQRISTLRKSAVAELNNKLIGRTGLDVDVKRTAFELGMTNSDAQRMLPQLNEGEFYTFGTAISKRIEKHKISPVRTTHVKIGMKLGKVSPPSNAIQKLIARISDIPKEVEQEKDLVKKYQEENSGLKKKVHEMEKHAKQQSIVVQPTKMPEDTKRMRDLERMLNENNFIYTKNLQEAKKKISEHESWGRIWNKMLGQLTEIIATYKEQEFKKYPSPFIEAKMPAPLIETKTDVKYQKALGNMYNQEHEDIKRFEKSANKLIPAPLNNPHSENISIGKGERATLIACAQFREGLFRTQISVMIQYAKSSRDAYIHRLKEKGLVTTGDKIRITQEGIDLLGDDYKPLPTGDELREHWLNTLPQGEKVMLNLICNVFPASIPRNTLTEKSGYAKSSRDAYLHRMLNKEIIEITNKGEVRASETLFG